MADNKSKLTIEDYKSDFIFKKTLFFYCKNSSKTTTLKSFKTLEDLLEKLYQLFS